MAQVLIRELDDGVVEQLKEYARSHGRSLEAELRLILSAAAEERRSRPRMSLAEIQALFARQTFTDSGQLQREDRER